MRLIQTKTGATFEEADLDVCNRKVSIMQDWRTVGVSVV